MNFYSRLFLIIVISSSPWMLFAQTDSLWQKKASLTLTGFADVFYVNDFNRPQSPSRQTFLFNHNRHNEFNLNLGLIHARVQHSKYRANFGWQTGTYANDNYAAEPGLLKNIYEANIGLALNESNSLWIDAGIMPSHIGFESALSIDNLTLTRSLVAENSPYYLTGAKLTWQASDQWELAAMAVNGWQRIQRLEGNSLMSWGTQVIFRPTEKTTLNWSTFIGTDTPDEDRRMRYFNNMYGQFQLSQKWNLLAGFDLGIEQDATSSSSYDLWLGPVLIGQYKINNKWAMAFRAEYYQDKNGVIISTGTANGFQTTGFSLNLDYTPIPSLIWRLEGRLLRSMDDIFEKDLLLTDRNFIIGTSLALKFQRTE